MKKLITLCWLALVIVNGPVAAQIYVDVDAIGTNDGSSWANAYTTLHDALENYHANDEIWVAEGTYLPQQPSAWTVGPKNTFYLYQDVALYGGFDGTETLRSERAPTTNITTLSGDLNGDDVMNDLITNRGDNVLNVVFCDTFITPATVIDGFTISGGHASMPGSVDYNSRAGGMWSWGAPQITDCRFTQNYAEIIAGGLYLGGAFAAEAVVKGCVFEGNEAVFGGGGMVVVTNTSDKEVEITDCQFIGNNALNLGAGLALVNSSTTLRRCQLFQNTCEIAGGGIYSQVEENALEEYRMLFIDCAFDSNQSARGGGFYYETNSKGGNEIIIDSCTFTNNLAVATNFSTTQNIFPDGGAMGLVHFDTNGTAHDSISISNCLFQGNTAERIAGGIYILDLAGTDNFVGISNSQFIQNSSDGAGGGIYVAHGNNANHCEASLTQCDFEGNVSGDAGGFYYVTNSLGDNDLILDSCTFTNNHAITTNLIAFPDGGAMGIIYFGTAPVPHDSISINNCLFQENTAERHGGGIYLSNASGSDHLITISNSEFVRDSSNDSGGGLYVATSGTVADGTKIRLIDCEFEENVSPGGGGMRYRSIDRGGNDLLLTGTDFIGNKSISNATGMIGAGGLSMSYSGLNPSNDTVRISDCVFEDNISELNTGGLSYTQTTGTDNHLEVSDCAFMGNEELSGNAVGGLGINDGGGTTISVLVRNTRFRENAGPGTAAFGVGVPSIISFPTVRNINLVNCLFTDHHEHTSSSAVLGTNRYFTLTNCTVADNQLPSLRTAELGRIGLRNNILKADGAPNLVTIAQQTTAIQSFGGNLVSDSSASQYLGSQDVQGLNPEFNGGGAQPYQLVFTSPAVDLGAVDPDFDPNQVDLAGNPRFQGISLDAGAFESPFTTSIHEQLDPNRALSIFPNPIIRDATVELENEWMGNIAMKVYDAAGRLAHIQVLQKSAPQASWKVDFPLLPAGTYQLVLSDDRSTLTQPFVRINH